MMGGNNPLNSKTGHSKIGGHGPATRHFWMQRVSAVALIPLTLILTVMVLRLVGAEQAVVAQALGHPLAAAVTVLLIVAVFWHLKLGLQTVIEDYVHHEAVNRAMLLTSSFVCVGAGAAATLAVLKLAVAG
jgi:succinate dehydrogenase / fumarate reductase membrane anchor subunit